MNTTDPSAPAADVPTRAKQLVGMTDEHELHVHTSSKQFCAFVKGERHGDTITQPNGIKWVVK